MGLTIAVPIAERNSQLSRKNVPPGTNTCGLYFEFTDVYNEVSTMCGEPQGQLMYFDPLTFTMGANGTDRPLLYTSKERLRHQVAVAAEVPGQRMAATKPRDEEMERLSRFF